MGSKAGAQVIDLTLSEGEGCMSDSNGIIDLT